MIASLEGTVAERSAGKVVVVVGGVGYEVLVPTAVSAAIGPASDGQATVRLLTRLVTREDSLTLYGFSDQEQRGVFDLLTAVTGVGPKVALAFLSSLRPDAIRRAVITGDPDALTVVPGVGKKLAQRVVLDLRDRMGGAADGSVFAGPLADVRDALIGLGLTQQEASEALVDLDPDSGTVEELLRHALRKVGR